MAVAIVLLGACGDDSGTTRPDAINSRDSAGSTGADGVIEGLCLARRQATTDAEAARSTFLDTAHEGLHDLARELGERDRSAAAAVLQAKQQVEADLDSGDAGLVSDLDELVDAATAGYAAMGDAVDGCQAE